MNFPEMLFLLISGHAVADYPLQGEFLALGKSRARPSPFIPWYQALGAHALIHGGMVALITGVWWLGLLETACHAIIDDSKCAGKIGFNTDQSLHILCKVIWACVAVWVMK